LLFLAEVNRLDLKDSDNIPEELVIEFIKRRRPLVKRLKDKKKSKIQKQNWRKYRWKYLNAIRKWHRSIQGKRFHRNLGKFLALRFQREDNQIPDMVYLSNPAERFELLKLLSSLKTHLYIEGVYYKPILEQVEYELLIEEVLPLIEDIEKKILIENILSKEDYNFLIDLLYVEKWVEGEDNENS